MTTTKNKVQYGLSNVHYALATITSSSTTKICTVDYGIPKPINGAVNLSLSPEGESKFFYADNVKYSALHNNQGYSGDLEVALLSDEFWIDVFGATVEDGVLVENAKAKPKSFALLFEFDGDVKARRHVLYWVEGSRPNIESATTTDSSEAKTQKITITARPRPGTNNIKAYSTEETSAEVYNAWFESVWEPTDVKGGGN